MEGQQVKRGSLWRGGDRDTEQSRRWKAFGQSEGPQSSESADRERSVMNKDDGTGETRHCSTGGSQPRSGSQDNWETLNIISNVGLCSA